MQMFLCTTSTFDILSVIKDDIQHSTVASLFKCIFQSVHQDKIILKTPE